jgi:hypothetical protein
MSEINNLTPEQIARLDEFKTKWFAIALSTDPADRLLAQDGVKQAYEAANLKPPGMFIWLRSPLEGLLAAALCEVWAPCGLLPRTPRVAKVREKVWGSVVAKVGDQAWSSVTKQVCKQVNDDVYNQLRKLLESPVWAQVWAQLGDHISNHVTAQVAGNLFWSNLTVENEALDNVWNQLRRQVRAQIGSQIGAQISPWLWGNVIEEVWFELQGRECVGQHSAGSLSFYDYFRTVFGVLAADRLAGLMQISLKVAVGGGRIDVLRFSQNDPVVSPGIHEGVYIMRILWRWNTRTAGEFMQFTESRCRRNTLRHQRI